MKALAILILMVSAIAVIGGTAVATSSALGYSATTDSGSQMVGCGDAIPKMHQHENCEQEQSGSNEYQYQWNCGQNCSLECQQHEYSHEYEYSFNSSCAGECQDNEFQHMNSNGQD
jgi:hypothetical protein